MNAERGRPRVFDHKKQRELLDHIAQGASAEEAAQLVGVSLRTVQREAKFDEFFDHDLQLALHNSHVDPHEIMLRAARTHWRAAAWLLERTDPDRFARRPPNSCSPEKLLDMVAWLIETALEATPPEHRETVYRRTRAAADKAFDLLMPDQHQKRRATTDALAARRTPLSDHEYLKMIRDPGYLPVVHDRDAQAQRLLPTKASALGPTEALRTTTPAGGGVSDADSGRRQEPLEDGSMDRTLRPLADDALAPCESSPARPAGTSPAVAAVECPRPMPAPHAAAGPARPDLPNAILSPKMRTATKLGAPPVPPARQGDPHPSTSSRHSPRPAGMPTAESTGGNVGVLLPQPPTKKRRPESHSRESGRRVTVSLTKP